MACLEYDFADPTEAKLFPSHGWAVNSQGVKILWCPLKRFLETTLGRKAGSGSLAPKTAGNAAAFSETLRKLARTLRELHQAIRTSCDNPCSVHDPEALTVDLRAMEMVPLYVDLAFTYLRRLPDLLVVASRPVLFDHWQSVPMDFSCWVSHVDDLASHKPSSDFTVLREAIVHHSRWFNELRDKSSLTGKKGIRDTLEHRRVRLLVGKQQAGDDRPRYTVMIDSPDPDVEIHKDILHRISDSVAGLCHLMTGIHSAIGVASQYEWGDVLSLVGTDDDIVGYWPKIHA